MCGVCAPVSTLVGTCFFSGAASGAATGTAVSAFTHFSNSTLFSETPLAAVVPFSGMLAGAVVALPLALFFPRLMPRIRDMIAISMLVSSFVSSFFAAGGLDMGLRRSAYSGLGTGAAVGVMVAVCSIVSNPRQLNQQDEIGFTYRELISLFSPCAATLMMELIGAVSGIFAGVASGFGVSYFSERVPEDSPLQVLSSVGAYAAGCLTAAVPLLVTCALPRDWRRLARMTIVFSAAMSALFGLGGLDMSNMRSAASGAGMGAAVGGAIGMSFSGLNGISMMFNLEPLLGAEESIEPIRRRVCRVLSLTPFTVVAGAAAGVISGGIASQLGQMAQHTPWVIGVAPAALCGGVLGSALPSILMARCSCIAERVKFLAYLLIGLTALASAGAGVGAIDLPFIRAITSSGALGAIVGVSAIAAQIFILNYWTRPDFSSEHLLSFT